MADGTSHSGDCNEGAPKLRYMQIGVPCGRWLHKRGTKTGKLRETTSQGSPFRTRGLASARQMAGRRLQPRQITDTGVDVTYGLTRDRSTPAVHSAARSAVRETHTRTMASKCTV